MVLHLPRRVPLRRLQQHASELVDRVEAGEKVEITRNGRLVAILVPPDPEEQVYNDLVAEGLVDEEQAAPAAGLADWRALPARPGTRPLSETLHELREAEEG